MKWIFLVIALACTSARGAVSGRILELQSPISGERTQVVTSTASRLLTLALQDSLDETAAKELGFAPKDVRTVLSSILPLASSMDGVGESGTFANAIRSSPQFSGYKTAVLSQPAFVQLGSSFGPAEDIVESVRSFLAMWVVYQLIENPDPTPIARALADVHASFMKIPLDRADFLPQLQYQFFYALNRSPRDTELLTGIVQKMLSPEGQIYLRSSLESAAYGRYTLSRLFWIGTGTAVSGLVLGAGMLGGAAYLMGEPQNVIQNSGLFGTGVFAVLGGLAGNWFSLRRTGRTRVPPIVQSGFTLASNCQALLEKPTPPTHP